jgi:serine protease Do
MVKPGSPAAKAGVRTDDLILFVNERVVPSCKQMAEELTFVDRLDPVKLTIQRGQDLVEISIQLD